MMPHQLPPWGPIPPSSPIPSVSSFVTPVNVPERRINSPSALSLQSYVPSRLAAPHTGANMAIPGSFSEDVFQLRQSSSNVCGPPTQEERSVASATAHIRPMTPPTTTPTVVTGPVHIGVTCDECTRTIIGIRHKCLDCPGSLTLHVTDFQILIMHHFADFDLCATCMESGSATRHNPFHEFFDIEEPVGMPAVLSGDGERVAEITRHTPNDSGSGRNDNAGTNAASTDVHNATCDLCDSRIVGMRYVSGSGTNWGVFTHHTLDRNVQVALVSASAMSINLLRGSFHVLDFDTCASCFR